MSLLTIIQNALNEIGDLEVPSSIFNNANPTAVQSLALANRALDEAIIRTGWQPLSREESVSTVAAQEEYSLPSDFISIIDQTMWNQEQRRFVRSVTPKEWNLLNSNVTNGTIQIFYRIFRDPSGNGQKLQFFPTPTSIQTINYEYISKATVQSSGGTLQTEFLADTDTPLLDEVLITLGFKWMFLHSKGFEYAEAFRSYETRLDYIAQANGSPIMDLATPTRTSQHILVFPETGFGVAP